MIYLSNDFMDHDNIQEKIHKILRTYSSHIKVEIPELEYTSIGNALIGCYTFDKFEKKIIEEEDLTIAIEGYFFVEDDGWDQEINLRYILEKYRDGGIERVLSSIKSGIFNLFMFDKQKNTAYVINDRFGLLPLYYHIDKEKKKVIFSSEMKLIIPFIEKISLDLDGISDYLFYSFTLGDKTFVNDIHWLMPAGLVEVNLGNMQFKVSRYWDISYKKKDYPLEEYVKQAEKSLNRAMKRFDSIENSAITLSGGLDARTVYALLKNTPKPYTLGYPNHRDVKFAKRIAQKRGMENVVLTPSPRNIYEYLDKIPWIYENHQRVVVTNECYLYKNIRDDGFRYIYNGIGGEFLKGAYLRYARFYFHKNKFEMIKELFSNYSPTPIDKITKEELLENFRNFFSDVDSSLIKKCFKDEIYQKLIRRYINNKDFEKEIETAINSSDGAIENISDYIMMRVKTSRYIAYEASLTRPYGLTILWSLLDYELFDFELSVPVEIRADRYLVHELYKNEKRLREYSEIPHPITGVALKRNLFLQKLGFYLQRLFKRIRTDLFRKSKGRFVNPGSIFTIPIENWVMRDHKLRKWLVDIIKGGDIIKMWGENTEIERMLNEFRDECELRDFTIISKIIYLEVWYSKFFKKLQEI